MLMGPELLENGYFKKRLGEKFRMNEPGPVSWYLGI